MTLNNTIELTAIFLGEQHVFQDETPQRYIIGKALQKLGTVTNKITVKGESPPKSLLPNVEYRFAGQWKTHPKYGSQFAFDSFAQPEPITREAIVGYLTQCPNIGIMRAEKIYDALGHDCISQIKNDPNILNSIKGLNDEQCSTIQSFLLKKEAREKSILELQTILKGLGFPKYIYSWLENNYGTAAASIIRRNPYILTAYRGVGFMLADKVYEKLGLPPAGNLRQWNYLVYLLTSDTSGSTWMQTNMVSKKLTEQFGKLTRLELAYDEALANRKIVERKSNGIDYISLPYLSYCETEVTQWIYEYSQKPTQWPDNLVFNGQDELSEHQQQAYATATQTAVGLLTGGPGTGKTFVIGRIIDTLQRNGESVAVCAPTGKAALRVIESLKRQNVFFKATTIHKLLGATIGKDGWEFTYNTECKLPYDFIIVDESSMIDIVLLKSLLDAVKEGANVLFVGDHEQLPPVGKGAPLRDMIQADVPCGKLTEIRRNAGEIVKACAAIRDNAPIDPMPKDFILDKNLVFFRMTPTQEKVFCTIKNILEFEKGIRYERIDPFNALQDCQILVPLNEKSELSRKALNPLLQDYFNPLPEINGDLIAGKHVSKVRQFRRGDKIICTKNGTVDDVYVANGEIGIVKYFSNSQLTIDINGQLVDVPTYGDWSESVFELGYAISCHKFQGSESPVVIVLLDSSYGAKMICDKHWIYTAISRAKKQCYLIGMSSTLDEMKNKSYMWNRTTLFTEMFNEKKQYNH